MNLGRDKLTVVPSHVGCEDPVEERGSNTKEEEKQGKGIKKREAPGDGPGRGDYSHIHDGSFRFPSTYPTPLTVWIRLVENGSSTFFLSLLIATSTTLASLSKLMSQICSEIRVRLQDLPGVGGQKPEDREFLRGEIEPLALPVRPMFEKVDLEVGYPHDLRAAVGAPAEYGANAGQEF